MIQKISHKNIDRNKYRKCVESSYNYRIYAEDWYLDIVAKNKWDCLVYKDYEAIMPLPYKKKLGIKYIAQPIFCQQLGVFYEKNLAADIFYKFEKNLHKHWVRAYCFNEENTNEFKPKGIVRSNYILDLNRSYEELYKGFNKNRKRQITKINNYTFSREFNPSIIFNLYENHYKKNFPLNTNILLQLFKALVNKNLIIQITLQKDDEILSSNIFFISKNRIINFLPLRNKNYSENTSSLIFEYIIKNFNSQNKLIDFEGSMIEGVADFYKSFGSINKSYCFFNNL